MGYLKSECCNPIKIRPARMTDLDAIVEIAIAGFPYDPQWPYRYPYRNEFLADHYKYTRLFYSEYLKSTQGGNTIIMVAECPSLEDSNVAKVIAMSIWDSFRKTSQTIPDQCRPAVKPPTNHYERQDASPDRMRIYSERTMKARKEIFGNRYGKRQLALRQIVTLPAYWRRGAGGMLCKWGMDKARKEGLAIPMFASPMGKLLYESLGFKELSVVHVQVEGEDEELSVSAMAWEPAFQISSKISPKKKRRSRNGPPLRKRVYTYGAQQAE